MATVVAGLVTLINIGVGQYIMMGLFRCRVLHQCHRLGIRRRAYVQKD